MHETLQCSRMHVTSCRIKRKKTCYTVYRCIKQREVHEVMLDSVEHYTA